MGCAVSNTRTLCKGIGVENDKPGGIMGMMPKSRAAAVDPDPDITNNMINGHRTGFEDSGGGGFTQRMASFENNIVQKGKDTFGGIADKGRDTMNNAVHDLEDFGKSVGENVKSGAEDLVNTGRTAVEEFTHDVEDEVTKVSENVKSKVDGMKDKVDDVFDLGDKEVKDVEDEAKNLKNSVSESKEDIGEKIDEILALSIDENS